MGFSWGPYLAQECLKHCITKAIGTPQFIYDKTPSPNVSITPGVIVYVDNGIHVGTCAENVQSDRYRVVQYLPKRGLTTHEETDAVLVSTALGFVIDGERLEIRPKPNESPRSPKRWFP